MFVGLFVQNPLSGFVWSRQYTWLHCLDCTRIIWIIVITRPYDMARVITTVAKHKYDNNYNIINLDQHTSVVNSKGNVKYEYSAFKYQIVCFSFSRYVYLMSWKITYFTNRVTIITRVNILIMVNSFVFITVQRLLSANILYNINIGLLFSVINTLYSFDLNSNLI